MARHKTHADILTRPQIVDLVQKIQKDPTIVANTIVSEYGMTFAQVKGLYRKEGIGHLYRERSYATKRGWISWRNFKGKEWTLTKAGAKLAKLCKAGVNEDEIAKRLKHLRHRRSGCCKIIRI